MTQRTLAGLLAVPLLIALWLVALLVPLPFATYSPGVTIDVLGKRAGQEIIEVSGAPAYRDDGQLRLTTVYVSRPESDIDLFRVMAAWLDPDSAVYPVEVVHPPGETDESSRKEGKRQMASSQDVAVAVALTELGYDVQVPVVRRVVPDSPSDGVMRAGDRILAVDGQPVSTIVEIGEAVADTSAGQAVDLTYRRDGQRRSVSLEPATVQGQKRIGVVLDTHYDFPFDVEFGVDPDIGGSSAGLMFTLAVYDTLTEGSLTGGEVVAGTGTMGPDGGVGPIGGIDQKIAAARDDGAALFLVPPDNCEDALDSPHGDMRLARAATLAEAVDAIETWAADADADLPSCDPGTGNADA